MSESPTNQDSLAEEFRRLGKNLGQAFQAAWESPERKQLQNEVEVGLNEFGKALREEVERFSESPTGQQLKTEVQGIEAKIRSGEAEAKLREEIQMFLSQANTFLQETMAGWSASTADKDSGQQGKGDQGKGTDRSAPDQQSDQHQEVHPDDVSAPDSNTGHQEVHPDDLE